MKRILILISFLFFFNAGITAQEICPAENISVLGGDEQNIVMWDEPLNPFTVLLTIEVVTDIFNGETSWDLVNMDTGELVASIEQGSLTGANISYTWDYEIPHGNYSFTIYDSFGDGIYAPGGFALSLDGVSIYSNLGEGWTGTELTIEFNTTDGRFTVSNNSYIDPVPFDKGLNYDLRWQEGRALTGPILIGSGFFSITREVPEECGTFTHYAVYSGDGTELGTTTEIEYTHEGLTNGTEYCYYVTVVYEEGTSDPTEDACGTPSAWVAEAPTNLMSFPGDEEMVLVWQAPGGGGGGTQGDIIENPFVVTGIPFEVTGTTDGFNDDYDEQCPYTGSTSNDVVYMFSTSGGTYDFSLCESGYDTKIYIYDVNQVNIGCNDDACNSSDGSPFRSLLESVTLEPGLYYVVVDGYGGQNGEYELVIDFSGVRGYNYDTTEKGPDEGVSDSRTEYDFLGYNIYVDNTMVNSDIVEYSTYTVAELSNEETYTFGVVAVYEGDPNYESEMITVTDSPVYLFGDITGTIVDPNGDPIDSVAVSSEGVTDTTGTDGTYTLWNLSVGIHTVQASRSGFYTANADVDVAAQADPSVQDFVLSPDVPWPSGLDATPLDEQVYLSWGTPGSGEELTIQYDDGILTNAFYFFDTYESGYAHGMRFDVGGGFDVMAASIKILSEGDEFWPWPNGTHGPVRVLIFDDDNGMPGNLLHDEEAVAEDGFATVYPDLSGLEGSVYVIATHLENWADPEGFGIDGGVDYPDNMYTLSVGSWLVGDALGYGGDYMMAVQVMSYGGGIRTLSSFDNAPDMDYNGGEINSSLMASTIDLAPMHFSSEPSHPVFNTPINTHINRDELLEYRVYEVAADETETLVATTPDTFATVTASPNYQEYCYQVRAFWTTDSYGDLESRPSNVACTVPYTLGDADFDSDCDISDVLVVVDFILEEDFPTEDEFRNVDVNMDEEINIADVILMIDIIFGGAGRSVEFDASEVAYIDLVPDYAHSRLSFEIEYSGPVRGFEFELEYDPALVEVHSPGLSKFQDHVMVSSKESGTGVLKILAADLQGGAIEGLDRSFITIPVEFIGHQYQVAPVSMEDIRLAGADGSLVNVVARTTTSDVKAIPGEFALQQNFPNPFNPSTEIRYDLPEEGFVNLAIYNMVGQKVRTLRSETMQPGYHSMVWDGRNDVGSQVATGMYFYSIHTGSFQATKKMLFLK